MRCAILVLLVRAEEPVNLRGENAKEQLKQAKGGDNKSRLKSHTGHRTVGRSGIDEGRSASSRLIFSSDTAARERIEDQCSCQGAGCDRICGEVAAFAS